MAIDDLSIRNPRLLHLGRVHKGLKEETSRSNTISVDIWDCMNPVES